MAEGNESLQYLENNEQFKGMPSKMQEWIFESKNATQDYAEFFQRGGRIEIKPDLKLPYFKEEDVPKIYVDETQWGAATKNSVASAWPQRFMFGTLAHEIGHDKFNTGNVPFTGKSADEYVQYRAGLEANAIFNAFPIFRDLESLPEFKQKPFGSIGYLNEIELGALYGDWRAGKLDDAAVVKRMAAEVANAPYTLGNPPKDMNRDGVITHRDAYLRDFERHVEPKLRSQAETGLSEPASALGDKLRGLVGTLDQQANKGWDENSDRLLGAALVMGTEKRFSPQDELHLSFNNSTDKYAAGELLHLFRTGPNASPDPYNNRAQMLTVDALSVSLDERLSQVHAIALAQVEQQRLAQQQELTKGPDDPSRGGPKFTM